MRRGFQSPTGWGEPCAALKRMAHSESGLKPTLEPVLTGFRYEAGISIPDGVGGTVRSVKTHGS
jgi:hypothetical protein